MSTTLNYINPNKKIVLLRIESLCGVLCIVHKKWGRLKVLSINFPKPVYLVKQVFGTICIQESEWASSEWRKSQSKYRSNVSIKWAAKYPLLQTPDSLVDETRCNAKLDLLNFKAEWVTGRDVSTLRQSPPSLSPFLLFV